MELFKQMRECVLSQPHSHSVSDRLMFILGGEEEEEEGEGHSRMLSNTSFTTFIPSGKAMPAKQSTRSSSFICSFIL